MGQFESHTNRKSATTLRPTPMLIKLCFRACRGPLFRGLKHPSTIRTRVTLPRSKVGGRRLGKKLE